jgi:3-deoxy-D-arabino-heptulosonate 7-phosphate (DAHP) synthase class II
VCVVNITTRAFGNSRRTRSQAVHLWHLQVHQSHIGLQLRELLDRLTAARTCTRQRDIGFSGDVRCDALTEQRVIVHDEDSNGTRMLRHGCRSGMSRATLGRAFLSGRLNVDCCDRPPRATTSYRADTLTRSGNFRHSFGSKRLRSAKPRMRTGNYWAAHVVLLLDFSEALTASRFRRAGRHQCDRVGKTTTLTARSAS